jgi:hypothetical protein
VELNNDEVDIKGFSEISNFVASRALVPILKGNIKQRALYKFIPFALDVTTLIHHTV